jgi:hypothetical protein
MSTFRIYMVLPLLVALRTGEFSAQGAQKLLSVEEAEKVIRDFEQDPRLALKVPKIHQIEGRTLYEFRTPSGDQYWIEADTGRIRTVYYGSLPVFHRPTQLSPVDSLPMAELQARALEMARKFYPDFAAKNMVPSEPRWDGQVYEFIYSERLPNGAGTLNWCGVLLASEDGRLASYSQNVVEIPTEASRPLRLSQQEAIDRASAATPLAEIQSVDKVWLRYRRGELIWEVPLWGLQANGVRAGFLVTLNADTGKIHEVAAALSSGWGEPLRGRVMLDGVLLKPEVGPITAPGKNCLSPRKCCPPWARR